MGELFNYMYGITNIPNEFLERYLTDTKSEYLKFFLFYLWKGHRNKYTLEEIAEEIDLDIKTVDMAVKYWGKKKLIDKKNIVAKHTSNDTKEEYDIQNENVSYIKQIKKIKSKKIENADKIDDGLLFSAEKLLGQTLSERQVMLIEKCYNDYGFSQDVILYFLEYCSNVGKTDARYMSQVAATWYEQGVKTEKDAKKIIESYTKTKTVRKNKKIKVRGLEQDVDYDKIFNDAVASGRFQ